MEFWELQRIIKGYRRRSLLTNQLLAEVAYAATFATRDPKGKTVKDLFPLLFSKEKEDEPPITEDEREELQQLMRDYSTI